MSQLNRKNRREGESERFITTKKLFFKDLNWGTDIFNLDRQEYRGIKVGADEFKLYEDNCVPKCVDAAKRLLHIKLSFEGALHPSTKMAVKGLEKLHSLDIYYQNMRKDDLDSNQVVVDVAVVDALNECEPIEEASTSRSNYLEDSQEDSE